MNTISLTKSEVQEVLDGNYINLAVTIERGTDFSVVFPPLNIYYAKIGNNSNFLFDKS
jgi:hypothetical protein